MPSKGKVWRHIVIGTHCSWLPGSKKGWRSRRHRRHSSGDYKNPPPPSEHDGLLNYSEEMSGDRVEIPWSVRPRLLLAIVKQFRNRGYRVIVAAVSGIHSHLLVELPFDLAKAKRIVGLCKGASSHRVRDRLAGKIWADGARYLIVSNRSHQDNAYYYIRDDQGPAAFVWTSDDGLAKPKPLRAKKRTRP